MSGQIRYEPAQDVASAKPSRLRAFSGAGCWYVHSHTEPVAHFEIRSAGRHLWTCVLLDAEHLTVMGSDRTFVSEARASAAALAFSKLVNPSREDAGSPAEGWTGLSPGRRFAATPPAGLLEPCEHRAVLAAADSGTAQTDSSLDRRMSLLDNCHFHGVARRQSVSCQGSKKIDPPQSRLLQMSRREHRGMCISIVVLRTD